jgi:hypothetical protein
MNEEAGGEAESVEAVAEAGEQDGEEEGVER